MNDANGSAGQHERTPESAGFRTLAVHGGQAIKDAFGAIATPIFLTSTFGYSDFDAGAQLSVRSGQSVAAQDAQSVLAPSEEGYFYSRLGNPTVAVFERRMAALEDGDRAIAFSSGMAAITSTLLALVSAGESVIYVGTLYGGTESVMRELLPRFGIEARQVANVDALEHSITKQTRVVVVETPSNPHLEIHDLARVADIARRHHVVTVADNTFATPYLTRPLSQGIDVVVHSATKYIGGHGDATGGVVISNDELSKRIRSVGMKHLGGCLSPHDAYMFIRGLKTLPLRMNASCETAQSLAEMLRGNPNIERVYYPGLKQHPGHDVAQRQMKQYGSILSIEVRGGLAGARTFLDSLKVVTQAVSVGDVDSLACHPWTTTHSAMPESGRLSSGITKSLVRLSIGVEDGVDLTRDIERALAAI